MGDCPAMEGTTVDCPAMEGTTVEGPAMVIPVVVGLTMDPTVVVPRIPKQTAMINSQIARNPTLNQVVNLIIKIGWTVVAFAEGESGDQHVRKVVVTRSPHPALT